MVPRAARATTASTQLSKLVLHAAMPSEPGNAPALFEQSRDAPANSCTSCAAAQSQREPGKVGLDCLLVSYEPLGPIARSVEHRALATGRRWLWRATAPDGPSSLPAQLKAQRRRGRLEQRAPAAPATTEKAGVPPSHAVDAPRVKGSRIPSLAEHNSP